MCIINLSTTMQLFASNIPYNCTPEVFDSQIKNSVADAKTRLIMKPIGASNKGYGFVEVGEEASKILLDQTSHGIIIDGRRLKFVPYINQQKFYKLHVSNIPLEINESELFEVFSTYGVLDSVKIDIDFRTKTPRGTAMIVYTNYEDFSKVLQLGTVTVANKQLTISKRRMFKRNPTFTPRRNAQQQIPLGRPLNIQRPQPSNN